MTTYSSTRKHLGFSLIEVVLAIGIFLVTVLALVGLLGPTLQSIDEVEKTDEVASVVNTLNAFLQSSPDIALRDVDGNITKSKFDAIYDAVVSGNEATLFVYRFYDTSTKDEPIRLEIGFAEGENVGINAKINQPLSNPASFPQAAGSIYRVVLTASSVTPTKWRSEDRNENKIYILNQNNVDDYTEGSFVMEARIFAEAPPGPGGRFETATVLRLLADAEPSFTYNIGIVR